MKTQTKEQPKKPKTKDAPRQKAAGTKVSHDLADRRLPDIKLIGSNYTLFDYVLMLTFVVLLAGMFYLKSAEESFGRDRHRVEMDLKGDNYYRTLGVEPGSRTAEIKKKYRQLAVAWYFAMIHKRIGILTRTLAVASARRSSRKSPRPMPSS